MTVIIFSVTFVTAWSVLTSVSFSSTSAFYYSLFINEEYVVGEGEKESDTD